MVDERVRMGSRVLAPTVRKWSAEMGGGHDLTVEGPNM